MSVAIVYSEKYLEHVPGPGHPERPDRLKAIVEGLKRAGLWHAPDVEIFEPNPAIREEIELAHDPEYITLFEKLSAMERPIDADTPVHKNTLELAMLASGGAIMAGRLVVSGDVRSAFALVRPPGHHASRSEGGGFCYFNNAAVMIKYVKKEFNIRRVFILDIDAHHGNGTQDIFYDDPTVLYMSIHQHPSTLYPGTGFVSEIGSGEGKGYNVNVPVGPGSDDADYEGIMREIFLPLSEQFRPELFVVSVGFDAHIDDPLTSLQLSTSAYGWLADFVIQQAERMCESRVIFLLEGGYDLNALSGGVLNIMKVMRGERFSPTTEPKHPEVIDEVKLALSDKWKL